MLCFDNDQLLLFVYSLLQSPLLKQGNLWPTTVSQFEVSRVQSGHKVEQNIVFSCSCYVHWHGGRTKTVLFCFWGEILELNHRENKLELLWADSLCDLSGLMSNSCAFCGTWHTEQCWNIIIRNSSLEHVETTGQLQVSYCYSTIFNFVILTVLNKANPKAPRLELHLLAVDKEEFVHLCRGTNELELEKITRWGRSDSRFLAQVVASVSVSARIAKSLNYLTWIRRL